MVEYFYKAGHDVHATYWGSPKPPISDVVWHNVNLMVSKQVKNVISQMGEKDIVIHAAASTSGANDIVNNPEFHVTNNAVMNSLVFRAAYEVGVGHVIFFSCTTMLGSSDTPQTEEATIDIHPKYFGVAHTKLYSEKLCEFFGNLPSSKTKFTAIRHSNIYGPYDKYDLERSHVFGATVTKVMTQDRVVVWGEGGEARDLLHVEDLCEFVRLAIEKQPGKFGLYNCGLGKAISVSGLVTLMIAASGKKLSVEYDLARPTIPTSLSLDCTKAKTELGWEPKISLEEGIEKTLAWYKHEYCH
jgi:nucleoside-diphosphate-sugar epimerase